MFHEVWSKKDYDLPGFSLEKNMTVLDIGANQGFFSLYAAVKGATVYAFEPCSDNFSVLSENVHANGLEDKIKLFNAAVTGKNGPVLFFVGQNAAGRILSGSASTSNPNRGGKTTQTRSVDSVTLDSVLQDHHIEHCDFLKMDCEGAEYDILRNTSRASFAKIARIAMECHSNRMSEAVAILQEVGFKIVSQTTGEAGILKAVNTHTTRGTMHSPGRPGPLAFSPA
jgi:FkbM family methyltransferase